MPVRPRDAASLIPVRRSAAGLEVLMGRRARAHRFLPDVYVFPGGRGAAADSAAPIGSDLRPEVSSALTQHAGRARSRALAVAAVRETFEETGLVLGELRDGALAPALDRLDYVLRAITPTDSPIRFHARFFMADLSAATDAPRGNGELLDLAWRPLAACLALPLADITEYLLMHLESLAGRTPQAVPLFAFRGPRIEVRVPGAATRVWVPIQGRKK